MYTSYFKQSRKSVWRQKIRRTDLQFEDSRAKNYRQWVEANYRSLVRLFKREGLIG